jgi:histidine kinase-like protein
MNITTPAEGRVDDFLGWTWSLPPGPECAGYARGVLATALDELDVPGDLAFDARLMVSELATNAYQHAGEYGPHELWVYATAADDRELRCAVFDRLVDACLPGYSWTSGDHGRGLDLVAGLSGGRWGVRRDLVRTGKAVWFTVKDLATAELSRLRGPRPR